MALIRKHPHIEDYFVEMPLADILARGGVADLFEQGQLILIKDYLLDFDFGALEALERSTDAIPDREMRKRIKKLTSPYFFEGEPPVDRNGTLVFADPVREAIFDVMCRGDRGVFDRAAQALKYAHDEILRIFRICFPGYKPFRFVPSVRLTQTLFENLHWDNHSIDDDFHQARIFANLDTRPRIWNVGDRLPDWMRKFYHEHQLGQFAGKDPNLLIDYVSANVLGGTRSTWMDQQPRHRVAFDPGEVWLGESRLISHQIVYGESAMVYMWFVETQSMANDGNRFNNRVENLHREMAAVPADPVAA